MSKVYSAELESLLKSYNHEVRVYNKLKEFIFAPDWETRALEPTFQDGKKTRTNFTEVDNHELQKSLNKQKNLLSKISKVLREFDS